MARTLNDIFTLEAGRLPQALIDESGKNYATSRGPRASVIEDLRDENFMVPKIVPRLKGRLARRGAARLRGGSLCCCDCTRVLQARAS